MGHFHRAVTGRSSGSHDAPRHSSDPPASQGSAGSVVRLPGIGEQLSQDPLPERARREPVPRGVLLGASLDADRSRCGGQRKSEDALNPIPVYALAAHLAIICLPSVVSAKGIWVSPDEIAKLPTSGSAWDRLLDDADRASGSPNVSDQDSNHDVAILAAALVCARTGDQCAKARNGVVSAIGTEQGGRWLAVGRNMTAYVIAADVLGLYADGDPDSDGSRVEGWIRSFHTMLLSHNNDRGRLVPLTPFDSGSNASAQEGAVYIAVAAYLQDRDALDRGWDAFRTYACDPGAPDRENIDLNKGTAAGWAHDDSSPCAVNPADKTKVVPSGLPGAGTTRSIGGAIINDMRRGGDFQFAPGYTSYPWVGLEGFVPAALILDRAGYPAFEIADRAVLRTHEYLFDLMRQTGETRWFDGKRADEVVHLVNVVYGKSYPTQSAVGAGRTVGYTDWTHLTIKDPPPVAVNPPGAPVLLP
jgi:hypothetical protein